MSANQYTQDNAARPGIALTHTLYGEPANSQPANSIGSNIGRATFSTAPYVPPKRRHRDNPERELCAEEGCKAYPLKDKPYCTGHARAHGLMPTCAKRDCHSAPMGDTNYCYYHQPEPAVSDEDLFE